MHADDVVAITQVVHLYGHVVDGAEWHRLGEVFGDDGVFDITAWGGGRYEGLDAVRAFFAGATHPPAHHTTNVVVTDDNGVVRVHSKLFGPDAKGRVVSGDYRDVVVRTPAGWRIAERVATRRHPRPAP